MTELVARIIELDDGRKLSFADIGPADGRPVMFCHSLPGARLMPQIAHAILHDLGLRMIVPDRPGFGFSDFKPGRTVVDGARDVAAVADFLEIDTFYVLGVSAGCQYVLACCMEFPERIYAAGIASGITPADEAGILPTAVPAPLHFAARRARPVSHALHQLLTIGMRRSPDRAMDVLRGTLSVADQRVMARPEASAYVHALCLEAARDGVKGWVYDEWLLNQRWANSPQGVSSDVPLYLWWGDEDTAAPVASGQELARQIPHSSFRVIEDCGHFGVMFDHVRRVLAELSA